MTYFIVSIDGVIIYVTLREGRPVVEVQLAEVAKVQWNTRTILQLKEEQCFGDFINIEKNGSHREINYSDSD